VPEESEWLPLDPTTFRQRLPIALALATPFWVLLLGWSLQISLALFEGFPILLRILILLVAAFGIGSAALLVAAWLHPAPSVNFGRGTIRVRRRELAFADIDTATVALAAARVPAPLQLAFGRQKGLMAHVILRSPKDERLAQEYVDRLLRVLGDSSIVLPADPYDPQHKFARYNFPGALDKDAAIELVGNVPAAGAPQPFSPRL
jgi:hypothetical protein